VLQKHRDGIRVVLNITREERMRLLHRTMKFVFSVSPDRSGSRTTFDLLLRHDVPLDEEWIDQHPRL
jgi:hypothetical protein